MAACEHEAALLRLAAERAVHHISTGELQVALRWLSDALSGTNAGRDWLRAAQRDAETAARCRENHLTPLVQALEQGKWPSACRCFDRRLAG